MLNKLEDAESDRLSQRRINKLNERLISNEEQNSIAEILYDLANLLARYDSPIAKRESIELMRRALDKKVLIFGVKYAECIAIKQRLKELLVEHAQYLSVEINNTINNSDQLDVATQRRSALSQSATLNRQRSNSLTAPTGRFSSTNTTHPPPPYGNTVHVSNVNCSDMPGGSGGTQRADELSRWIEHNSIIRVIPPGKWQTTSKRNITTANNNNISKSNQYFNIRQQQQQQQQQYLKENSSELNSLSLIETTDYFQTSVYADQSEPSGNLMAGASASQQFVNKSDVLDVNTNSNSNAAVSNAPFARSNAQKPAHTNSNNHSSNNNNNNHTAHKSVHKRLCYIPTATSIDVHNAMTVSGPNSDVKQLARTEPTPGHNRLRKLKNVYYKSAWYDVPPGSSKLRFKSYIKLAPNAF